MMRSPFTAVPINTLPWGMRMTLFWESTQGTAASAIGMESFPGQNNRPKARCLGRGRRLQLSVYSVLRTGLVGRHAHNLGPSEWLIGLSFSKLPCWMITMHVSLS